MKLLQPIALLLAALLLAIPLRSVGTTGTLVGTVTDPTGAVVVGARVTVRNQETDAVRRTETGELGSYTLPLLPPGLYEVSVFAQLLRPG